MSGPIITLLTDFGMSDGYVAAMKGVILEIVPDAILIDAGHDLQAHDVQAASWVLAQYAFSYPDGSIHIAVVDPQVGTNRDLVVASAGGHLFFAPNNGLLHWISRNTAGFEVSRILDHVCRPEGKSNTFHGRDVLAYAAGRIASGFETLESITEPLEEFEIPAWGEVRSRGDALEGEIIHVDRFGNMISNIHRTYLEQVAWNNISVQVGEGRISNLSAAYADVMPGEPLVLVGSHDYLEIAVYHGSAARSMGLKRGAKVVVQGDAQRPVSSGVEG